MKIPEYKLKSTRNEDGAVVMILLANDREIFATSRGYQLGCALHALGIKGLSIIEDTQAWLMPDKTGTILGHEISNSLEECLFWAHVLAALSIRELIPNSPSDPEYNFVSCLLPGQMVKVPHVSFTGAEEHILEIKKSIYFPFI